MKRIYILASFFSKNWLKTILIVAQSLVLTFLLLYTLNPIMLNLSKSQMLFENFSENDLLFIPNLNIRLQLESEELGHSDKVKIIEQLDSELLNYEQVEALATVSYTPVLINENENATLFYYSDELLEKYGLLDDNTSENVIVVTNNEDDYLHKEHIQMDLGRSTKKDGYNDYEISNVIDSSDIQLIKNYNGGTTPLLSSLFNENEGTSIIMSDRYFDETIDVMELGTTKLVFASDSGQDEIDSFIHEFNNSMKTYGELLPMQQLYYNQINDDLLMFHPQLILIFVLLLLIIFGLNGYVLLSNINNAKLTSIYYICGMSIKRKNRFTYLVNLLLIFLPMSVCMIFYYAFSSWSNQNVSLSTNVIVFALNLVLFIVVNIISKVVVNKDIANNYRRD